MYLTGLSLFNQKMETEINTLKIKSFLFNPNPERQRNLFNHLLRMACKMLIFNRFLFNSDSEINFRPNKSIQ